MSQPFREASQRRGRRQHTCLLYQSPEELKQYLLPFIKEGLTNGEHCLFVCPADSVDDWSLELQAFGIDVIERLSDGSLVIATGEQWRESELNSVIKARELWQHIDQNLASFPHVRIAGDASWVMLDPPIGADRLCHWEATADLIYEDQPVQAVCMYDLNTHSPSAIRAALRTHSYAVIDGLTYSNPYYEAQKILDHEPDLNVSDADGALVAQMLASIRSGRRNLKLDSSRRSP
jgi:hypothetical protein